MGRAVAGYGLGMGLITLTGISIGASAPASTASSQFNLFLVLLSAYTPLLTPFSSTLGLPAINGSPSYGAIPLLTWVAVGMLLGVMTRSASAAAKAAFLTSSTTLLLWLGCLFFSAPAWPDNFTWLSHVNQMALELISRPIDLSALLILPTVSSAATGGLAYAIETKLMKQTGGQQEYDWP